MVQVVPRMVAQSELQSLGAPALQYELVPLLELPKVDVSLSVKTRFIRIKLLHRIIHVFAVSRFTFVGFLLSVVLATGTHFVPAHVGRGLAIVGFVIGMPAIIVTLAMLRYELVCVLLKTYDYWFFGIIATFVSLTLAVLFHDGRALFAVTLWLSVIATMSSDANLFAVRRNQISSAFTGVWFLAIAIAVSTGLTPDLLLFDIFEINGHALPATVIVRDGMQLITLVVLRNIYRLSRLGADDRSAMCVTFRCRLQLRPLPYAERSITDRVVVASEAVVSPSTHTQLRLVSKLESVDEHKVLISWVRNVLQQLCRQKPMGQAIIVRILVQVFGIFGFLVSNASNAAIGFSPHFVQRDSLMHVVTAGLVTTTIFTTVCLGISNRKLLRGIFSTFDGLFVFSQCTLIHIVLVELTWKRPMTTQSLCSSWLWTIFLLSWDAITPSARQLLGLSPRFATWIAVVLFGVMLLNGTMFLVYLPAQALNNGVINGGTVSGHRIELRALSWFYACAANISMWCFRFVWRLSQAVDGELVQLDGMVTYDIPRRPLSQKTARHGTQRMAAAPVTCTSVSIIPTHK